MTPAPPPASEPTVMVPRDLFEEAIEDLAQWGRDVGVRQHFPYSADDSAVLASRLRAALAEPQPAELNYSPVSDNPCPGCDQGFHPSQLLASSSDGNLWHADCLNSSAVAPSSPKTAAKAKDTARDDYAVVIELDPDSIIPTPPETAANLEKPHPNGPGDLRCLLKDYLDDANIAIHKGDEAEAAKLIATMQLIVDRCPTLAAIDEMVDSLMSMAQGLRARLNEMRSQVSLSPEEQP